MLKAKGAASRAAMLNAARKIILEKGIEKLSHANIAQELNLSKSAVHWHFATKEDLLRALVAEYVVHLETEEARHEKKYIDAGFTPAEAILPAMRDWYNDFELNTHGWIGIGAALIGLSRRDPQLTEPIREWYRGLYKRLGTLEIDTTEVFLAMMTFDALFNSQKMGLTVLSHDKIAAVQARILERAFATAPALLEKIRAIHQG